MRVAQRWLPHTRTKWRNSNSRPPSVSRHLFGKPPPARGGPLPQENPTQPPELAMEALEVKASLAAKWGWAHRSRDGPAACPVAPCALLLSPVPAGGCSLSQLLAGSVSPQHCSSGPLHLQPAPWVLRGAPSWGQSEGATSGPPDPDLHAPPEQTVCCHLECRVWVQAAWGPPGLPAVV